MKPLLLARACACFYVMKAIDIVLSPIPRSPAKAKLVNTLVRPFAPFGMFWALYTNPTLTKEQRDAITMKRHGK